MATTIKLKNSVTTTNAPSSLVQGEVAINITDKKVWVGNAAGTPIQLLGAGGSASFGALTCTSLTNSGLTSGQVTYATTAGLLTDSANLTFNGTTLTAAAITSTGVATFSAGTVSDPALTTTGDTNTGIFFPAADTIAFTEGGAEAMRIDNSGRVGIGTTTPATPLQVNGTITATSLNTNNTFGFKNRIINGAMVIDQRNAGASVSVNDATVYTLDRWIAADSTGGVFSVQQVSDAPSGLNYSLKTTVTTADASIGATEYALVRQRIEGFNFADLNWGTANAKTITLSFWAKSSLTGTFGGALINGDANRSYPFSYTISATNTWEYKTVTIAGDTTGTWNTTNGIAVQVDWSLAAGSTYTSTAGSWSGNLYLGVTGQTQVMSTLNATWQITGVQLEVGSTSTSFDYRPYGTELALCQRYYQFVGGTLNGFPLVQAYTATANNIDSPISFPVSMRTTPTTAVTGTWALSNAGQPEIIYPNAQGFSMRITATTTGALFAYPDSTDDKMTFSAEL